MDKIDNKILIKKIETEELKVDKGLLQPFLYIYNSPGSNFRRKISEAFNQWLKVPQETVEKINIIVELVHTNSLICDDIEDNSNLRRGIPTVHTIFGFGNTINTVNYVHWLALMKCLELNRVNAIHVLGKNLSLLEKGQGLEMRKKEKFIFPSEKEYYDLSQMKTGSLLMLPVALMQEFSPNKNDFSKLIEILSGIYQFRNDYLNLVSKEYQENKSFCEDFTEGKFSLPVIHAITNNPDTYIYDIIKKKPTEYEVKKYCLNLLNECGSLEYTKKRVEELIEEARQESSKFGHNPSMENLLNYLSIP